MIVFQIFIGMTMDNCTDPSNIVHGMTTLIQPRVAEPTMDESFTKHLTFLLLAENFKKQSFEA